MTSTGTHGLQVGDIIYAKTPGGQKRLRVKVLHVADVVGDRFILGRRVRSNADGSTSTYGGDNLYYVPEGWNEAGR